jgi:DNA-binding CsgD family transcriptional regulator
MALGEPGFAKRAVDFVNTGVVADHVSLFMLDHELVPHFLDAASLNDPQIASLAGRLYERSLFYRHDPNTQHVSGGPTEDVMMFRQRASDILDANYRDRVYRRFNLLERISLIHAVNGRWYVFNVYRDVRSGACQPRDLDWLSGHAALLVACTAKHAALVNVGLHKDRAAHSNTYLENLLASIEPRLTHRERQVCSLALKGRTVEEIAEGLKVQPSTVATLRRRAYAKLGITKLNGLFALCIAKISRQSEQD